MKTQCQLSRKPVSKSLDWFHLSAWGTLGITASLALFSVFSSAQTVTDVFTFNGANSLAQPAFVTPVQGRDGTLYGTASGSPSSNGAVFRLRPDGKGGALYIFSGVDGSLPGGSLTLASDGNYYGTTFTGGGFGFGVLFRVSSNGTYSVLHNFAGGLDGSNPYAPPIEASDGNLYGTTTQINFGGNGTVYRYSRSGVFTTLYNFDPAHGVFPIAPLLQASDGNLYGTAQFGGGQSCGTVYKISTAGVLLRSYDVPCNGLPTGPLIQASDGNFYGTTASGGPAHFGTVFRLTPAGFMSTLHEFAGPTTDGNGPFAGVVQATDGNLYGATILGGVFNQGILYKIGFDGSYTLLYNFPFSVGSIPTASLLQHTSGLFYGVTELGGAASLGTVYSLDVGLGPFITFVRATGKAGKVAQILGQGLTGTTSVTFNGVNSTSFKVASDTYITATVPIGAASGPVVVTTPTQTLTSNKSFVISK